MKKEGFTFIPNRPDTEQQKKAQKHASDVGWN